MHSEAESHYDAAAFDGATGGERIQAALDRAAGPGQAVVSVTGAGPDDGVWETSGLVIGNHTALVLRNATLRLADGAGENVLRNRDLDAGNDGISVIGVGAATVDGNAPNQPRETDNHGYDDKDPRWIGLRFEHCDDLTVRDLRIERTTAWGVKCEAGDRFEAANLRFEQDDTYINQDGVHVAGPARDVTVRNLTGTTWDDAVNLNVGGAVDAYGPLHGGGDIEHVVVRDVRVDGHRPVRVTTGDGHLLRNVEIANVATWGPVTNEAIELNASYADALPAPDEVRDVTVRNVEHRTDAAAIDSHPATLRFDEAVTGGRVCVRDVIARAAGPAAERRHTVVAVEGGGHPALDLTLEDVEGRGVSRLLDTGAATTRERNVRGRDADGER